MPLYEYTPPRAGSVEELARYLETELFAIYQALAETEAVDLRVTNLEPERPRDGMIVFADGTNWAPGAGRGLYVYDSAWGRINDLTNVKHFGATGNGTTDDTAAIESALTFVNSSGGGTLYFPEGTFSVADTGTDSVAVNIDGFSNVHIVGAGRGATIIKLANSADDHLLNFANSTGCSIRHLTLDGNRANQTATNVHALRGASLTDFAVEDVEVKNAASYGVGLQTGTFTNVRLLNLHIHDVGDDGIDWKNLEDNNSACFMDNILVEAFNLKLSGGNAGVDVRGPVRSSNIVVHDVATAGDVGIRLRDGELLSAAGLGAHESSLTNFRVTGTTGTGVASYARNVQVSDGIINGCSIGALGSDVDNTFTNIHAINCATDGFELNTDGASLVGDRITLIGCLAKDCGGQGFDVEAVANAHLQGCRAISNGAFGARVQAGATDTLIEGCHFSGNTSGAVSDSGTDTHARNNSGWVTEGHATSPTFAVDAIGLTLLTVPHGLAVTPDAGRIQATLVRESTVQDYDMVMVRVDTADATNAYIRVKVSVASGTAGATAKVGLYMNARP